MSDLDPSMRALEKTALRRRDEANDAAALLRRIRKANIIFPSMCANNMEAMNLLTEIDTFLARFDQPFGDSRP